MLAIVVGVVFASVMARGLTRGLQQLVGVTTSIRGGERSLRTQLGRRDELGLLGENFNAMLDTLEDNESRIREAQERLRRSEERFELAMKGANDGLWDWDHGCGRVYYSPRWKAMLGHADQEIGESLDEWRRRLHPEDREATLQSLREHLEGESAHFESVHRMAHRDGSWRWHMARGVAGATPQAPCCGWWCPPPTSPSASPCSCSKHRCIFLHYLRPTCRIKW